MQTSSSTPAVYYAGTDGDGVLTIHMDGSSGKVSKVQRLQNVRNLDGLKQGTPNGISTRWILLHPSLPYLYAITSFWDTRPAVVVTYLIVEDATLKRLGSSSTLGYEAVHATLSPDGRFLAIAHSIGGSVTIFKVESEGALRKAPVCTATLPGAEVVAPMSFRGRRSAMAHGLMYSPFDGKYLYVCDCGKELIWKYTTNTETGMIEEGDDSAVAFECPPSTWFQQSLGNLGLRAYLGSQPRHVAMHPSGSLLFVIYEATNVITWHKVQENDGLIGEAIAAVSTLDDASSWSAWNLVSSSIVKASEMAFSEDGSLLYVSNRGMNDKTKNSIVTFAVDADAGTVLPVKSISMDGIPIHFLLCPSRDGDNTEHCIGTLVTATQDTGKMFVYDRLDDGGLNLVSESEINEPICCLASPHQVRETIFSALDNA